MNSYLFFLTLTQKCNLSCTYCGSSDVDMEDIGANMHPTDITYDPKILVKLSEIKDLVVCFYGGEPLLAMNTIYEVMDSLPNAKFCLQTNGILIHRCKTEYINKFSSILVSIDGDMTVTDISRGNGTYKKTISNCEHIRKNGFTGDLIARMTVTEISDIYEDVLHLIYLDLFDHVHWQLDVLWDSPKFARWDDFLKWRDNKYLPGIAKLANHFVSELKKGKILGIVPFLGLLSEPFPSKMRCRAGMTAFNITTGGKVTACPIAPEMDILADINTNCFHPKSLENMVTVTNKKCLECECYDKCGGRCLYATKTNWWGDDGFDEVCVTVKHLLQQVDKMNESILPLVEKGIITMNDLKYPIYNNSVEIIP